MNAESDSGLVRRAASALLRPFAPESLADLHWLTVSCLVVLLAAGAISAGWIVRYSLAIHRLNRGVGDTTFYSADGQPWFRLDEQRRDVPLDRISADLQRAVVAVEDHRFYHHPGIDPIGLGRSLLINVEHHAVIQGGSTLTQQLARTLFLSNARTYGRKAKEAAIALMLEQQLTKNQILELYLNRVYLSAGVYGVEAMSQALFRKPAAAVSLAEAALIAGLIRAPSALSPWSNLDGAIERSHTVLEQMVAAGFITDEGRRAALHARFRVQAYPPAADPRAGYAKEFLRQQFRDHFGGDHPPDWQVHTTLLSDLQDAAERAVASGLQRLNAPDLQAALVALDPTTGDVLALVGGRDFRTSPFNRATRSKRQPGSAFKPFVYTAALEMGYSPVSVLSHLTSISAAGHEEWTPRNTGGENPDELTLRAALLQSNNSAAVAMQQQVGTRGVLHLAGDAGLRGLPDVPSLALGTGLVTPLELTAAFAIFPNGGFAVAPRGISQVFDPDGESVLAQAPKTRRVISAQVAFQMVTMLEDVVDRGTGAPARSMGVPFAIGGKTGTTDDFRDAWFVGFSSAVVTGVWVGFDQPATIQNNAYGARIALPIWADFMRRSARRLPPRPFAIPGGLRDQELCRISYLRPVAGCPTYVEYFKEGDEVPSRHCPIHQGTFKQRAQRAIEGFFAGLEKKLKGFFRR